METTFKFNKGRTPMNIYYDEIYKVYGEPENHSYAKTTYEWILILTTYIPYRQKSKSPISAWQKVSLT